MSRKDWNDEDERPTSRNNRPRSDSDHTLGQLMVESLNHRRRIEVIEARLDVLETASKDSTSSVSGSQPPGRRAALFAFIRKTVITTAVIVAAIISALKELGFLTK